LALKRPWPVEDDASDYIYNRTIYVILYIHILYIGKLAVRAHPGWKRGMG
jgi:hypothetical protein